MSPEQVYCNLHAQDKLGQLKRRITVVEHQRVESNVQKVIQKKQVVKLGKGQSVLKFSPKQFFSHTGSTPSQIYQ